MAESGCPQVFSQHSEIVVVTKDKRTEDFTTEHCVNKIWWEENQQTNSLPEKLGPKT